MSVTNFEKKGQSRYILLSITLSLSDTSAPAAQQHAQQIGFLVERIRLAVI